MSIIITKLTIFTLLVETLDMINLPLFHKTKCNNKEYDENQEGEDSFQEVILEKVEIIIHDHSNKEKYENSENGVPALIINMSY